MTALAATTRVQSDGLSQPRRTRAIASVLAAMVLVVLDAAIANIALPTMGLSLQVTPAAAVRVVTAYQLGLVIALLPAAAFGESVGYRRVFAAGTALFTVASIFCALSPSLDLLVTSRFVQGVGGGSIMALGVALLRFIVPKDRLAAAIGWNALTVALSTAVGPTLGAAILSVASWPWLFAINLPIGLGVLFSSKALPIVQGTGRPVDLVSVALNTCAFASLVIGVEIAPRCPVIAAALLVGAAAYGVVLVQREARRASPLVPLDLLRSPTFRISAIASVLCFTGVSAALVALPFHLQHTVGLSPLLAGFYLTPWPIAVAMTGPQAGRLANRFSTASLCLAGGLLLALGLTGAALLSLRAGPLALSLCTVFCGVGFGLFNVPNNRQMFLSAPRERSSAAGGLQGLARLSGQMAGALAVTLLFSFSAVDVAPRIGLGIAAGLTLAAGLVSILRIGPRGGEAHAAD